VVPNANKTEAPNAPAGSTKERAFKVRFHFAMRSPKKLQFSSYFNAPKLLPRQNYADRQGSATYEKTVVPRR
jgi:hypothetical protein